MTKNIPNILTLLRICMIPILIMSFYLQDNFAHYMAAGIFIFASITDYFDGFLARLWSTQSRFGAVLDPTADKMLVASALLMLVHFDKVYVFPAIAILCREILVSGLREHLAETKVSIPVSNIAKIKTVIQMIAITVLLLGEECTGIPYTDAIGQFLICIAAILTLATGYVYLKEGLKHL